MNIAENIKQAREKKGITQTELANLIGNTRQAMFQVESGLRAVSVAQLISICKALGCTPNDILGFSNRKEV